MAGERDLLVKRVFPRLRKLCDERAVTWGEVDLRWGIPDEAVAEGAVLPVCLAEIERCRPYFIGMLGERYGSVPGVLPAGLVESEPWLADYAGRSITELEILHGVLNDPGMGGRGFFYLRDPGYVDTLPAPVRDGFVESDPVLRARLGTLKDRIRESGFPVRDGYADPEQLGELVFEDLSGVINELFPVGSEPDLLDRLRFDHEGILASRTGVYVGRNAYFAQLDAVADNGGGIGVLGGSGLGKSALVANWVARRRVTRPDNTIVVHFVGATAQSAGWAAMLRRMIGELDRRFGLGVDVPDDPQELRVAFASVLYRAAAAADGGIVLVFDGVNGLEDGEGARELLWLPPQVPDGVTVVVSTLPGPAEDALMGRGWPTVEVKSLTEDERRILIGEFLAQYTKRLSDTRVGRIASASQAASPLFLRVLLEELRLFGSHERLDEAISHCLRAEDPVELFGLVLERFEQDYETRRPGLVEDAFSLLWAATRGLSEAELLDLLGDGDGSLPQALWSPLYLAAGASLVDREGLLGFAHDYLRDAIHDRYLIDPTVETAVRERLVDYFEQDRHTSRSVDELPYQLLKLEAWDRLAALLGDLDFLQAMWDHDPDEVKMMWSTLQRESAHTAADTYQPVVELLDDVSTTYLTILVMLLNDLGEPAQALILADSLVHRNRTANDLGSLSASLVNQAVICDVLGDSNCALELLEEAERICRELDDFNGLAAALLNQAGVLEGIDELAYALIVLDESRQLFCGLGENRAAAVTLETEAVIRARWQGDLHYAMELLREEERICRELGDREGLASSLGVQGEVHRAWGELSQALESYGKQEQICRELGDRGGLSASLGNQALARWEQGDSARALDLVREDERICREVGDPRGLALSLVNQARILADDGHIETALPLALEALSIARKSDSYELNKLMEQTIADLEAGRG